MPIRPVARARCASVVNSGSVAASASAAYSESPAEKFSRSDRAAPTGGGQQQLERGCSQATQGSTCPRLREDAAQDVAADHREDLEHEDVGGEHGAPGAGSSATSESRRYWAGRHEQIDDRARVDDGHAMSSRTRASASATDSPVSTGSIVDSSAISSARSGRRAVCSSVRAWGPRPSGRGSR
jgi:hypothetical protein